jgi:adenosine deaminase
MDDQVKYSADLLKYCYSIPKTELHAHLNGSIRKTTLVELLEESDRDAISQLYQNQMSFENAFKFFKISSKILTSLDVIRRVTREMIEDWVKVNCMYLEIRTSLKSIAGRSKADYLHTVLEEIYKGNSNYDMQTRLIISLNRELPLEDYLDTYDIVDKYIKNSPEYMNKLIVGIDYSGYETNEKHKFTDVIPIFKKFKDLGLKITIHIGEAEKYQTIDFNIFRPDRISHTYFFKQEECDEIMKHKIPIEVCPTGSYSIKNCISYKEITFGNYYNKVLKSYDGEENYIYNLYCINTDDTMLFTTDLSQEYYEVCSNFGLSIEDLKQMIMRTIDFIFDTDENLRNKLRKKLCNFD